ncbi:MAG: flavoprotein [Bacteroidetes bacterium]|nr:MAG: flavoprotein [Bacteroidota bacterium]
MKILIIPGSLRNGSSNHIILKAAASFIPHNFQKIWFDGLGGLPHFNDSESPPEQVVKFQKLIAEADGILICSPEYAFGVPGVLKNALDWTVGSGSFVDKPVALITAATGGEKAHASLLLTLSALSAIVPKDARLLISFVRSKINSQGEITDPETKQKIDTVIKALIEAISETKHAD